MKIEEIRNNQNLTKIEFGKLVGVNEATVYRWEKNISQPNKTHIKMLNKYMQNEMRYSFKRQELDKIIKALAKAYYNNGHNPELKNLLEESLDLIGERIG